MSQPPDHSNTRQTSQSVARPRLLIEDWLPITEIGIESLRERTPMTPFPAPNRLHVWFARRPLVASRAAILASLLPADADRAKFLHMLGIHGDPVAAKEAIVGARRTGERIENPYTYDRAFLYSPTEAELTWFLEERRRFGPEGLTVLDPTAGGGSIPVETMRLGLNSVANELNPVAWLLLKATTEIPAEFGCHVLERFGVLAERWVEAMRNQLSNLFPPSRSPNEADIAFLWARTIACPYCNGLVPLSPNWVLDGEGVGVRLLPQTVDPDDRRCRSEIVPNSSEQSKGTVRDGSAQCPFPDCERIIDGEEIKSQAQAGKMGQQLYAVVYKYKKVVGKTKSGKNKVKIVLGFRAPRSEDDVEALVLAKLKEKTPEWQARNIIPDEAIDQLSNYDRGHRLYGIRLLREMFSPRQLYGHCISVEVFHDLVEELRQANQGTLSDLDRAALVYVALAHDKIINYNSILSHWDSSSGTIRGKFDRHDFSFKWSFGEMASMATGLGYEWVIKDTGKVVQDLIKLFGTRNGKPPWLFPQTAHSGSIQVTLGSADALSLADAAVDCVIMDPPYYDNVMYAELSDFFYVWLKRTAGLLYPEAFVDHLTDKDREAVANPAKFSGQKEGARNLAERDYQRRMAAIFQECRRVLKPRGVMTVMFTHKASGAWDALASGLLEAGFVITASWPVNTEAEGSLHIKEKSAAKSTIFLVCRVREEKPQAQDLTYWEDIEPKVAEKVRARVAEFEKAGIGGVDLYLACFGPALQVFSESWPLTRGRALQENARRKQRRMFEERDPYSVRPEDALDAARREVKNWRMAQLASVKRHHHLDALTEWYVLAWDAFRAPRFPADEALKLARVVGLDFDQHVKNTVCEVKGGDVLLWDSKTRRSKGHLGPVGEECMIDTLHGVALIAREQNTGAAKDALERARLLEDPTLMTALEALLNVLPAPSAAGRKGEGGLAGAANDFVALEKLRRLAFTQQVPMPKAAEQLELAYVET